MVAKRDHYETLGVSRKASRDKIRRAFRKKAKDCHPDCAGPDGEMSFKELAEAHEVLSDPVQREQYDRQLDAEQREAKARESWPVAEPMAPRNGKSWTSWAGVPIRDAPSQRWHAHSPTSARTKAIELELVLSLREAANGGHLPLRFSMPRACPLCGVHRKQGIVGMPCLICKGAGCFSDIMSCDVTIPPGVTHGRVLETHAHSEDSRESVRVRLVVHIREFA